MAITIDVATSAAEKRREQKRLAAARYRARHPERQKEITRAYRERNAEKEVARRKTAADKMREEKPQLCMYYSARKRAKQGGYPCTISVDDIAIPSHCPILGIPLVIGKGVLNAPNSPTLDKIDPKLGYVAGNIQVISRKANTMKNDASREELVLFAKWVLGSPK